MQRGKTALSALTYLYHRAEQETGQRPRLIDGDCHGTPMWPNDKAALAAAVQVADPRQGFRSSPEHPIMLCTIRSSPDLPPPSDEEWAAFSRRVLGAASLLSEASHQGCRWVALGSAERQVHLVASLVHDDGRAARSLYSLNMAVFRECQSIGSEYDRRFPDAEVTVRPVSRTPAPAVTVAITGKPTGSVMAEGARDDLSAALLKHAGFQQIEDWYGRRHRLPSGTSAGDRIAFATHAAEMLRAARYTVDLDPALDGNRPTGPDLRETYAAGAELLDITDKIRAAESGSALADTLDSLLHPEHGALERVREALEAASEQITGIDDEGYQLADRFGFAGDFLIAAQSELAGAQEELRRLAPAPHDEPAPRVHDVSSAARATSPHAAPAANGTHSASPAAPPPAPPGQGPAARTR
ncbi:hypothetical protein [Streptomyces sp. NPDC021020]|uniref:hypothetical protein n=1 Tax=Streptomyces sp. NPDC021020 TaxID=3365109 RepID=UPI0037886814